MDKKTFCRIIKNMEYFEKSWEDLNDFFHGHGVQGYLAPNTTLIDDFICVLQEMMGDRDSLISWFCLTRDYGKKVDDPGSIQRISTPEELYDRLTCKG